MSRRVSPQASIGAFRVAAKWQHHDGRVSGCLDSATFSVWCVRRSRVQGRTGSMPSIEGVFALGLAGASIAWWLATAVLAILQPRRRVRGYSTAEPDGVSVIVPVASPAPDLGACLESLRSLNYPHYEIQLVADVEDLPAVAAIEREARISPGLIRALVVSPSDSPNPKVNLLAPALAEARHDLLLFTDDNAISPPSRVQAHLDRFNEGCMLVSAAVVGVQPEKFWGQVEAAFMNGYFSRLQLAGDRVGRSGVMGKSMLVRRSDIQRSGGLLATGGTCCEDAALQQQIARAGGRTGLSRTPMHQLIGRRTAAEVWARHRRWFFCRRNHVPGVFVAEVLLSAAVASACGAFAAIAVGWAWWAGTLTVLSTLFGIEVAFLAIVRWPVGPWYRWYPLAWLMREALVLPLCIASLAGGSVVWRNRRRPLSGGATR